MANSSRFMYFMCIILVTVLEQTFVLLPQSALLSFTSLCYTPHYRYIALNGPITRYPDEQRADLAMQRFLSLHNVFRLDDFLTGWFLGTPDQNIPKENIIEFVAYGFYCKKMEELSTEKQHHILSFVHHAEQIFGMQFSYAPYDPSLKFMAHVWEHMRVFHKPLIIYAFTEIAARIAHVLLQWIGFHKKKQGNFVTWIRLPDEETMHTSSDTAVQYTGTHDGHHDVIKRNSLLQDNNADSNKVRYTGARTHRDGRRKHTASIAQRNDDSKDGDYREIAAPRPASPLASVAHATAEHLLDAAVIATSAAAASVSKQYPHDGQQYRLPSVPRSPTPVDKAEWHRYAGGKGGDNNNKRQHARGYDHGPSINKEEDAGQAVSEERNTKCVPFVFLHGVGFGVLPYLHFIRDVMKASPASPIVVIEVPHVALRLSKEAVFVDEVAHVAVESVQELAPGGEKRVKACFIAHSYGTFIASRIVQRYPDAVQSIALIDPVCLMTCYPQLLFNFIYRSFSLLTFLTSAESIIDTARFICSRDLTISQAFCRKFHWSELMLWPEDLPAEMNIRALIVLSGKDDLVPSELVMTQFQDVKEQGHVTVLHHEGLGHGGFLMNGEWMKRIVREICQVSMTCS